MDETFVIAMFLAMFFTVPIVMGIDRRARDKYSVTSIRRPPILNLTKPPG